MSSIWYRLVVASIVLGGLFVMLEAQEPAGPPRDKGKKVKLFDGPAFKGPGKNKGAMGSLMEALRDQQVQEEIELVPDQIEELQALAEKVAADLEPAMRELKSLPKEEQQARMEEMRQDLAAYVKRVQAEIDKILLPHQQERLRQVALQLQMKKAGTTEAILGPDVVRELKLSDAQVQRIRENLVRIEQEYQQELADLEVHKQRRILAQFTPAQQEKLKALIGPLMPDRPKGPPGGGAPNRPAARE